ncbi:DUF805 domain-containing protein [Endobacterium cereale]|nr:DUF805 domain-containing protein [Endobacterium cereale]MEB2847782.1 DUF805 domain-containing protein [Endobacterium cereale]
MFETLFMFGGRLNRLQYFVTTIVISLVAGLIGGILFAAMAATGAGIGGFALVILLLLPFLWMSLSMQAARIRDIGLSPLFVIGGLIAFYGVLHLTIMASANVAMALFLSGLSIVSQILNGLLLLFMPGDTFPRNGPPPSFDNMPGGDRVARTPWDDIAIPSPPAVAQYASPELAPVRAARQPQMHAKPAFGRRGL